MYTTYGVGQEKKHHNEHWSWNMDNSKLRTSFALHTCSGANAICEVFPLPNSGTSKSRGKVSALSLHCYIYLIYGGQHYFVGFWMCLCVFHCVYEFTFSCTQMENENKHIFEYKTYTTKQHLHWGVKKWIFNDKTYK